MVVLQSFPSGGALCPLTPDTGLFAAALGKNSRKMAQNGGERVAGIGFQRTLIVASI